MRRFRPELSGSGKAECYGGVYVVIGCTGLAETDRYEKNVLVMFISSLESLHGVTPRQPTRHARLFMNLVGEVKTSLFDVHRTFRTCMKKLQCLLRLAGGEYVVPYK